MQCTRRCVVVPEDLKGRVIGKGGRNIREIEEKTGVRMRMKPEGAVLEGSEEAVDKAEEMIQFKIRSPAKKTIHFPVRHCGLVIGKRGATVQSIQSQTNTKIKIEEDGDTGLAHISGATEEQVIEAEKLILEQISKADGPMSQKTMTFPKEFYFPVIGMNGCLIKSIQKQTKTKIVLTEEEDTASAHISGATEKACIEAEQRILDVISRPPDQLFTKRFKKLAFVDGAYVGENNEFELEEYKDDSKKLMYHLVMQGDQPNERKEVDYLPMLEEALLEVLSKIYEENLENKNLRTDMWCHFGHAYICDVDEGEVGDIYQLERVNENLKREENRWNTHFKEGLEILELNALEEVLSKRPFKVEPNIRYDYQFRSPSGRSVRFKAFALQSNSQSNEISFQSSQIPMKGVLEEHSIDNGRIKYYLCAPYSLRLKVDIVIPYLKLDCHLVVRTSLKDSSTARDKEEDLALTAFINENLTLRERTLELREENLPDDFTITYKRECQRRTYPYPSNGVNFNVTISEEKSRQRDSESDVRTKTDIHLHCDEWDEQLLNQEWEPKAIVSKLPDFLDFLRNVQSNIILQQDD